jgi:hypothetical protein
MKTTAILWLALAFAVAVMLWMAREPAAYGRRLEAISEQT